MEMRGKGEFLYTPTLELVEHGDGYDQTKDIAEQKPATDDRDEALRVCKDLAQKVRENRSYYAEKLKESGCDYIQVTLSVDRRTDDGLYVYAYDVEQIEDIHLQGE